MAEAPCLELRRLHGEALGIVSRQHRLIGALGALVRAQDDLLAAYRLGDQRRGGAASARVQRAREAVEKRRAAASLPQAGRAPTARTAPTEPA